MLNPPNHKYLYGKTGRGANLDAPGKDPGTTQ